MPRNVRNGWAVVGVDGKASKLASGPRGADGGLTVTVYVRSAGSVVAGCSVRQWVQDGAVVLAVYDDNGVIIWRKVTSR